MARGDRNFRLLLSIMKRLGESREDCQWLYTHDLIDMVPEGQRKENQQQNTIALDSYLRFLEQVGYVELGTPVLRDLDRTVRLTATGEMFVQPELSQIENSEVLSQVFAEIERRVLSYPSAKGDGFLFELRNAVAANAPDVIAKLLVEALPKVIGGA